MIQFCCFGSSVSSPKQLVNSRNGELGIDCPLTPKNVRLFSYNSLRSATGSFLPANKLGRGGFGVVYKGTLQDGTRVAIKTLSAESRQGVNEFLTEIETVSNLRHPNLAQLIGCCVEGNNRMLVYEYLENNSLAKALHGPRRLRIFMDWHKRANICIGVAQGLLFLHEEVKPHVVHRDIKASNVLLDGEFTPKIGDFGLAKLFPDSVTHISTRVAGTMGYLAPEYALLGQLTRKADVYSFGVLILEIVSGRSSNRSAWGADVKVLVEWTWELRDSDKLLDIVDSELLEFPKKEVLRFIKVALLCTQAVASERPSMKQVVNLLSQDIDIDVSDLIQPSVIKEVDHPRVGTRETSSHGILNSSTKNPQSASFSTIEMCPR